MSVSLDSIATGNMSMDIETSSSTNREYELLHHAEKSENVEISASANGINESITVL